MTKTDPVEVAVKILDQFSKDLKKLDAQLDKIDGRRLNVSLDIDDDGSIEATLGQLKEIERDRKTDLRINLDGYLQVQAAKKALEKDTYSTHHIRGDPGDAFLNSIRRSTRRADRYVSNLPSAEIPYPVKAPRPTQRDFWENFRVQRNRNMLRNLKKNTLGRVGRGIRSLGKLTPDDIKGPSDRVMQTLSRLRPTIMMWWQLIALLIPMMIALAGAALGVVAAFGGIAVAGASIVGLGLLGYGNSLSESLENAKARARELANELFDAVRPVSAAFQPITEQLFDNLPHMVRQAVEPLMRLTTFGGFLQDAGFGLFNWIGEAVDAIADLDDEIKQVGMRFGRIIGNSLINLLSWAVREVYENQDAYLRLGKIFGDIIVIIFQLSKAVSFALATFEPLFTLIAQLTDYLSNKYLATIVAATLGGLGLAAAFYKVASAIIWMRTVLAASTFWNFMASAGSLSAMLGALYAKIMAVNGGLTLLHGLTGGVLLVGAALAGYATYKHLSDQGTAPARNNYAGNTYNTTINVNGNLENRQYQRMKDDFPDLFGKESTISRNRTIS